MKRFILVITFILCRWKSYDKNGGVIKKGKAIQVIEVATPEFRNYAEKVLLQ